MRGLPQGGAFGSISGVGSLFDDRGTEKDSCRLNILGSPPSLLGGVFRGDT